MDIQWSEYQLGNIGEWVGGIGAAGALIGAFVFRNRDNKKQRNDRVATWAATAAGACARARNAWETCSPRWYEMARLVASDERGSEMAAMHRANAEMANGVVTQLNEVGLTAPADFAPLVAKISSRLGSVIGGLKAVMNIGALKRFDPNADLSPYEKIARIGVEAEQGTEIEPSLEKLFIQLEAKIRKAIDQ